MASFFQILLAVRRKLYTWAYRHPQYRRVMIPLTVLRWLDCVLEATNNKYDWSCEKRWKALQAC